MIMIIGRTYEFLIVALLVFFCSCTSNPFDDSTVDIDKKQITGMVTLSDGASPQGVYVWLKGYDLATQTDEQGNFSVRLPAQRNQGIASGSIESDTLYFYLDNYLLETAVVKILDGEFIFGRDDIDGNGNVDGLVEMRRFLQISTSVDPPVVSANFAGSVLVEARIWALINCAKVRIPKATGDRQSQDGPLGAVLFKKVNSEEFFAFEANPNTEPDEEPNWVFTVCSDPSIRSLELSFSENPLPSGEYEVIPFIMVNPVNVPNRLLEIANLPFNELGAAYLKKPMRREDGRFRVIN